MTRETKLEMAAKAAFELLQTLLAQVDNDTADTIDEVCREICTAIKPQARYKDDFSNPNFNQFEFDERKP